jgi:hypothetical protein
MSWNEANQYRYLFALPCLSLATAWALVVTNVVRILSDVFDPASIVRNIRGKKIESREADEFAAQKVVEPEMLEKVTADIGHVFSLVRLVLVSPDIPAEALIGNRANFLKSSLRRFKEAYLFSNEGDEVLRMISTAANYFSFPTRSRDYGYRLENVEVLSENFGVIDAPKAAIQDKLRVGRNSIEQLNLLPIKSVHINVHEGILTEKLRAR